jgi:hypothetical protein
MKEAIKKWWLNIKPIKYITLKQKYNQLDTKYQALLEAEKNKCFDAILEIVLTQINIPEMIKKRDRRIKKLEKEKETLKETIKLLNEEK